MEIIDLKIFAVVWSYAENPSNIDYEEIEAENLDEAEERVKIRFGSDEMDNEDVLITRSWEILND